MTENIWDHSQTHTHPRHSHTSCRRHAVIKLISNLGSNTATGCTSKWFVIWSESDRDMRHGGLGFLYLFCLGFTELTWWTIMPGGLKGPHTHVSIHISCFLVHYHWSSFHLATRFPSALMDTIHGQNATLGMGGCDVMFTGAVISGDLIAPSYLYSLQVPWPPRSMAGSLKRWLRWEKWSSKTLRGAARPTDKPGGRGDAHGHAFPTRGPCRSRARWVFYFHNQGKRATQIL